MKNTLIHLTFLAIVVLFHSTAFAQSYSESTLSQQHLQEVNSQWEYHSDLLIGDTISFNSEDERIQYHLEQVVLYLSNNPPAKIDDKELEHRNGLLAELDVYAKKKIFPKNTNHAHRQPYFIDYQNTHCAVGYLMMESGNDDLAVKISEEHNYDYVKDIKTEGVVEWADNYGFTLDELKWIQPGYQPAGVFTPLQDGTNGAIFGLEPNSVNNKMIIYGDFDSLNNHPCLNIGKYESDQLSCYGEGIEGLINDVLYRTNSVNNSGSIYAVGNIIYNGSEFPLACFNVDSSNWEYFEIPNRPNCTATCIQRTSGQNIILTISHPTLENYQEIWVRKSNEWIHKATLEGVVNDIVRITGYNIYLAGKFTEIVSHHEGDPDEIILSYNFIKWDEGSPTIPDTWTPIGNGNSENISDEILTIEKIGEILYLGGKCGNSEGRGRVCLSKYMSENFEPLIQINQYDFDSLQSYNSLIYDGGSNIIIVGNFIQMPIVGTIGRHILSYSPITNSQAILGNLNGRGNGIELINDEIIIAGSFNHNSSTSLPHIAKMVNPTEIKEVLIDKITISPNPFLDRIVVGGIQNSFDYILFDSKGNRVTQGKSDSEITQLSHLSKGTYLLQIDNNNTITTHKVVKK